MTLDFYRIREHSTKNGTIEVFADFRIVRSKDLMIRGKQFYAIWDEARNLWSTDEFDVQRLVDEDLDDYAEKLRQRYEGPVKVKYLGHFSSNSWMQFRTYIGHLTDSYHQLDESLTFANTVIKKDDYVSRRLPYPLQAGDFSAWREIIETLYDPTEQEKIEWAIGAIVCGDSKKIQKFIVWYGAPGTGKGTILDIIMKLFEGYFSTFEAKTLTGSSAFAAEAFRTNPLVAIDPDGDMSRIEDNTRLNSIVSHEPMTINEKYKPSYTEKILAMLLVATNKSIKFTDAKSGLIRRMIDVHPSGRTLSPRKYHTLMSQVEFELGAIAAHCLEVYEGMGRNAYSGYQPVEMMLQTDVFFNYIETNYELFKKQNGVTLTQAYLLYKEFCDESALEHIMPKYRLREELKNYFDNFEDRAVIDDVRVRSWYSGFNADHFKTNSEDSVIKEQVYQLVMNDTESLFDEMCTDEPAQYAAASEYPAKYWTNKERMMKNPKTGQEELMVPPANKVVNTVLSDLDTTKLHYVKIPDNHIVIDFDLTDGDGNKSAQRNLEAASKWPSTYAEHSKSGAGVHLHYIYEGDVSELSRVFDDGIEIKVYTGDSSLRRKLSRCNSVPVASINSGLPLKEKTVLTEHRIKTEKGLRDMIMRNLHKEFGSTKPSMDFIKKILDEAYTNQVTYDLTDLRPRIISFANGSSNQAQICLKMALSLKYKSEDADKILEGTVVSDPQDLPPVSQPGSIDTPDGDKVAFFDVEVFPNLFIICWKYEGSNQTVRMINPSQHAVEDMVRSLKLVGFNNRKYDNHILYGAYLGYDTKQLYSLSQKLISNSPDAVFREAYNLSYTDIYDFSSKKQGLKKWQIELGIQHKELGLPWDKPVPENMWNLVADYCVNDVEATEAVWTHIYQDFVARQILADVSGLSINASTAQHTSKIVFGDDRHPQESFNYTELKEMFPGYEHHYGKSTYRGEETGEGGYVYAEPGMYEDVALLDIASMHPTSIETLNLFGKYTKNFSQLKEARLAIKRRDYDSARNMLGGKLARHLEDPEAAEALSYALKIVINIVYGLTSARFDNTFKDPRNVDNIVAKRGALFMINLKHEVQQKGFTVAHIKTDSIKIPNATPEIIQFVMDYGKEYGYDFEHEDTYKKFCLVNNAVYVAQKQDGKWTATGAQFQHPYVFKTLFSREPITFRDKCEAKHVTTALYLDFSKGMAEANGVTGELRFVGKSGLFCPIEPGAGGGILVREKDGEYSAATGSKGHEWLEADIVESEGRESDIDLSYFQKLVDKAVETIEKWGNFEQFRE